MPQTGAGNLGLQLGSLLFGKPDDGDAFMRGQVAGATVADRMASARKARADALNQEGQNDAITQLGEAAAKLGLTPDQSAGYQTIGQAGGGNAVALAQALGALRGQGYQADARTAALGGDLNAANANLMGLATKPVDLAKITDGIAFNPTVTPSASNLTVTPLGEADIGLKNAQAAKNSFQLAIPNGDGTTSAGFIDPTAHTFSPITQAGGLGTLGGPAPASSGAPMMDFATLAKTTGAQITSELRSPEHNAAVGGVPDSQHIAGTAADFVVRPEQKPAFIAQAQAMGYQAIDEGNHVHLQLPHGGLGSLGGDGGTGVSVGMGGGAPEAPPTTMARAPKLAFGQAPAKATGVDTFAKNKAFADQLQAAGAITTPEEYQQVLTTGKVQQSDADVHLSPADEQVAQGLASYAVLPSSLGRSKNRAALIARAMQINPDYSEAQSKQAYTYLNDLGKSGPTSAGGLVQSMNTLLEHGAVLLNANAELSGTGSQTVNRIKNAVTSEFGGTEAPNYNQAVNFYSQELGKLVKGGVANEGEVRDIIRDLDPSRTPEQRSQAILQAMEFVHGRIKAVEDRGNRVLGPMAPDASLLTKESQDILSRAYQEAGKVPPVMPPPGDNKSYIKAVRGATTEPSAPSGTPQPGQIVDGFRFKGGDPSVQANWEAQ